MGPLYVCVSSPSVKAFLLLLILSAVVHRVQYFPAANDQTRGFPYLLIL